MSALKNKTVAIKLIFFYRSMIQMVVSVKKES